MREEILAWCKVFVFSLLIGIGSAIGIFIVSAIIDAIW